MRGRGEEVCSCGAALRGLGRVCDGVGELGLQGRGGLEQICLFNFCLHLQALWTGA
jgi:hypothetical protein